MAVLIYNLNRGDATISKLPNFESNYLWFKVQCKYSYLQNSQIQKELYEIQHPMLQATPIYFSQMFAKYDKSKKI